MKPTSKDAYRLHDKVVQWQDLATRQMELAIELRQLASRQRELVVLWDNARADELTARASEIEVDLRNLWTNVVNLEKAALEQLEIAVAGEAHALRRR